MKALNLAGLVRPLVLRAGCLMWLASGAVLPCPAQAQWSVATTRPVEVPPPAPPITTTKVPRLPPTAPFASAGAGLTLYSIGNPTDEEQLYLEYINRSRANPAAEALRLRDTTDPDVLNQYSAWSVDLALMVSQFNAITSAPPLSFNSNMIAAARGHSSWMYLTDTQSHYEGTNDPGNRLTAAGYNWSSWGENVYAYAKSVWFGYAGLNVDWGPGTGGMQTPPGHRDNIHEPLFREIGIGVFDGSNTNVGPQLVTQDFGDHFGSTPLITGVVYYDLNGNGFYDAGEGIGGVTVNVSGASYYAVSSASGGYSVPSANGARTITFTGTGLDTTQKVATITNGNNAKVDFTPVYRAPTLSGTNRPIVNASNSYAFTAVGAATGYQARSAQRVPSGTEGAENGLTNVTVVASPGYSVIVTDVKASGTASFHLAHPTPTSQLLTLNRLFRANTNAQLRFASRLGSATTSQVARAQITTNGGAAWASLWSQAGAGSPGETTFTRRTNSLAAYAGREFGLRFVYEFNSGTYYNGTNSTVGLYLDDISFGNVEELTNLATNIIASGTNFSFNPTAPGDYTLRVQARLSNRYLDYGPDLLVTATNVPIIRITQTTRPATNQLRFDFSILNVTPTNLQLFRANPITGSWTNDTNAVLTTNVPGTSYRFTTTSTGLTNRFYRVKAP